MVLACPCCHLDVGAGRHSWPLVAAFTAHLCKSDAVLVMHPAFADCTAQPSSNQVPMAASVSFALSASQAPDPACPLLHACAHVLAAQLRCSCVEPAGARVDGGVGAAAKQPPLERHVARPACASCKARLCRCVYVCMCVCACVVHVHTCAWAWPTWPSQ